MTERTETPKTATKRFDEVHTERKTRLTFLDALDDGATLGKHVCCRTCVFSHTTDEGYFWCRRHAPMLDHTADDARGWDWDYWCGEWVEGK